MVLNIIIPNAIVLKYQKYKITANCDIKTSKYFRFQIEFRVAVLGTPKPSVQWYKDEVEIFSCERLEVKEEDEGGAVILKGEYYKSFLVLYGKKLLIRLIICLESI